MERYQAERITTARQKLRSFIARCHEERRAIDRRIREAEKALRLLSAIEDFT